MKTSLITVILSVMLLALLRPTVQADEAFGYMLTTDVVYGTGKVTKNGVVVERDLLMDVYKPSTQTKRDSKPAVVLVHGGAFHRGGLRQPPYREDGAVHSAMQDYARLLTPLGYVCFVIEYRLTPEFPLPYMEPDAKGLQPYREALTEAGIARTNFARKAMGLPEISKDDSLIIWNGILSAAEDLNKAVMKIKISAKEFGIDPKRIALGGHSAGATTVLNAAFGIKSPVKAAFSMSPAVVGFDFSKTIKSRKLPALLLLMSQFDEDAMLESVPHLMRVAKKEGLEYNLAWVPGFGHFYPTGAVTLGDDGVRISVGERVAKFLDKHLKK